MLLRWGSDAATTVALRRHTQAGSRLTSSSRRTTSVFPQRAAWCRAVPDSDCLLMSIPAWMSNLQKEERRFLSIPLTRGKKERDCYHSFITGGRRVSTPYYIDVSVLSSQVQRRDTVGIGGFRFQHGCTHVAAEQELDHLEAETQSERQKPD